MATMMARLGAIIIGGSIRRYSRGALISNGALQLSYHNHLSPALQTRHTFSHRRSSSSTALTMSTSSSNLVTVQQAIEAHKQNRNQDGSRNIFIDGSWHMPMGDQPRNGRLEYIAGPRIVGAKYFDIDDIAPVAGSFLNPKSLPHMKPSSKLFACAMDQMGITPSDNLYVYATKGCGFFHRAYWTLASCGYHDPSKVKLLQGSLDEWKESGGELENEALKEDDPRLFRMGEIDLKSMSPKYTCWKEYSGGDVDMKQVLDVIKGGVSSDAIIVDARSAGRFVGKDPEPRAGLRGGHMPGAVNVPFVSLLDSNDVTKFRTMEEVKDTFIKAGIAPLDEGNSVPRKVICTCGSGVTAAALAVGLEECGLRKKEDIYIYDGSWIEWGGDNDTPVVSGND